MGPRSKIIPVIIVTALLLTALFTFIKKYGNVLLPPVIYDMNVSNNRRLFFLNFYIPFALCGVSTLGCLFSARLRIFCVLIGFLMAILCTVMLDDIFVINLCIFQAFIISVSMSFSVVKSIIASAIVVLSFVFFLVRPSFLFLLPLKPVHVFSSREILVIFVYLALSSILSILLHFYMEKYIYNKDTVDHLNLVSKKLMNFNHRLQEFARHRGEQAVKQDRMRFTRDLHDSCGYAFTNIIFVTEAAISCGPMEPSSYQDIFQKIRTLATKGLKETRETLYLIRNIQEPYTKSIETVYQIKTVFEEVTGVTVNIEWGNMRDDYGLTVNKVVARIMQEAFTNSIRHGKANCISIQFWEFSQELSMVVQDNGIGASVVVMGIGLAGMKERVESVGGRLKVSLPMEGGFRLDIMIPLLNMAKQE